MYYIKTGWNNFCLIFHYFIEVFYLEFQKYMNSHTNLLLFW